jgi:hypothetical protein
MPRTNSVLSRLLSQPLYRLLPAVLAGAIGGLLFGYVVYPSAPAPMRAIGAPAGAEMMQMVRDEHAVIAGYLQSSNEQRQQADLAAECEIVQAKTLQAKAAERSEQLAAREAKQADTKLAETKTLALAAPAADKLKRKVATAQAAPPTAKTAAGMPLQLASAAPQIAPAPVMIAARDEAGPIRSRMRRVTAVVRRIPTWATSVAEWITDAVPSEQLTRLPDLNILRVSS